MRQLGGVRARLPQDLPVTTNSLHKKYNPPFRLPRPTKAFLLENERGSPAPSRRALAHPPAPHSHLTHASHAMVVMERTEVVDMDTDDPGIRADRRLIPLEIKVTFAFTNAPQAQYLMHYVTIDAWSDGSDTLAGVKQKFADKEGVPVEHIKFMWMDEPIGRCARRPTLSSMPSIGHLAPFSSPRQLFLGRSFSRDELTRNAHAHHRTGSTRAPTFRRRPAGRKP